MPDYRRQIGLATWLLTIILWGTGANGVSSVSDSLNQKLPQSTDSSLVRLSDACRSSSGALGPAWRDQDDACQQIHQRLAASISVDFKDRTLRQVIADLRSQASLPILLDPPALEKEGIDLDQPITMNLEEVSLKAVLNTILHQLRLGYVIRTEGLQITTERRAGGNLVQRTYPVADLLDAITEAGTAVRIKNPGAVARQALHKTLLGVIDPSSWVEAGGPGIAESSEEGTDLVVIQTANRQEQVAELLQALRHIQREDGATELFEMLVEEPSVESASGGPSPGSAALTVVASALCLAADACPFPVVEPPHLWTALANNPDLPMQLRRDCVLHLFRRHVQPGMKLSELAAILTRPTWLRRREVCNWNQACGSFWIPVEITHEDTTFDIRIFPELDRSMGVVYLRVSGRMESQRFVGMLRGKIDEGGQDSLIRQVRVSEPE